MKKTDALIIGAGPTGLFTAHQLKLIGLECEVVDNLDKIGGQCIELYPDKPIYDIPAVPECTGEELTNNLINQLKPFIYKIREQLAPFLGIDVEDVSVKATTTEKMGPEGRLEGISAHATVLLKKT